MVEYLFRKIRCKFNDDQYNWGQFLFIALFILFISTLIDLTPRFHLGDSEAFISTRLGGYIPENRSWTYGLTLGWIARSAQRLNALPLAQIVLSWAAYCLFGTTAAASLGLRRHAALLILAVGCLEPLCFFWSRSYMADSAAQSIFVLLCSVLMSRLGAPPRFILVFLIGLMSISLRIIYFPPIFIALIAAAAWSVWTIPKAGPEERLGGPVQKPWRPWAVAAAALLAANLAYAVVNTHMTHGRKLSTNVGDMEFLVSALSPLMGDQLDDTPLTDAERKTMIPLTRDDRNLTLFAPKGLTMLIRGHFSSIESARPVFQRLVFRTVLHHPIQFVSLAARQWMDYLNPVLVLNAHQAGWWSGTIPHGQEVELPPTVIKIFKDWRITPIPSPDSPSTPSPALWSFKVLGGLWSLALSYYATFSMALIFLFPKSRRTPFLIFSSVFSFLYMGEIAASANEMITRYLLPISATFIYAAVSLTVARVAKPKSKDQNPRLRAKASPVSR